MAKEKAKLTTNVYILKRGTHNGFDKQGERRIFNAGDKVELTITQAKSFGDKFELYSSYKSNSDAAAAGEAAVKALAEEQAKTEKLANDNLSLEAELKAAKEKLAALTVEDDSVGDNTEETEIDESGLEDLGDLDPEKE